MKEYNTIPNLPNLPNLTELLDYYYDELYLESDYEDVWVQDGHDLFMESRFLHLTPEEDEKFISIIANNPYDDDIFIIEDNDGYFNYVYLEYKGALDLGNYFELLFEVL